MKVLVVGSGGREHALAWALGRNGTATVFCAPGNPGISEVATCVPTAVLDLDALANDAERLGADLTIVGPEAPLAAGLVDTFTARGLRAFGPTRAAAALEGSKIFMKTLCARYEIPTSPFRVFENGAAAAEYVRRAGRPLVIKADGLAAGKGVVVAEDPGDGVAAVEAMMMERRFGDAGTRIVVEEVLAGEEVSVFAVCDGVHLVPLIAAQDHKRLAEDDRGPNTGGMGAVAPAPQVTADTLDRVVDEILAPTLWAMAQEGRPYRGVLFAGIMLTPDGPRVLEFNVRFGDPEAQVLLALLESGLLEMAEAALGGRVDRLAPRWRPGAAVCTVLCADGYPERPRGGDVITGLDRAASEPHTLVFHAGTAVQHGQIVTAGGRVLNVVATGETLDEARRRAYRAADAINYDGKLLRRDIGARAAGADARGRAAAVPSQTG
ncbi:MAG TPA: phosphoribosylamine--glycine ligase [bacterium]|nr:phosphoribosylamine--glycine ligase [bacterium]